MLYSTSLIIFLFAGSISSIYAQDSPDKDKVTLNKNIIHGSLGFIVVYISATINYERILTQNQDKFIAATFAKVGYGSFGSWESGGPYLITQYGILTGKNASHFEASAGPNIALNE